MKHIMLTIIFKYKQILRSIVRFVAVDMMNSFVRVKISTKSIFCNKAMFPNINVSYSKWMCRIVDQRISFIVSFLTTFPSICLRTKFSNIIFRHFFYNADTRTISSIVTVDNIFFTVKRFTTMFANYFNSRCSFLFNHFNLQIKKAAFGELKRIRLSIQHLRLPLVSIKNIALSLTNIIILNNVISVNNI